MVAPSSASATTCHPRADPPAPPRSGSADPSNVRSSRPSALSIAPRTGTVTDSGQYTPIVATMSRRNPIPPGSYTRSK
jgi:hypothetical protein